MVADFHCEIGVAMNSYLGTLTSRMPLDVGEALLYHPEQSHLDIPCHPSDTRRQLQFDLEEQEHGDERISDGSGRETLVRLVAARPTSSPAETNAQERIVERLAERKLTTQHERRLSLLRRGCQFLCWFGTGEPCWVGLTPQQAVKRRSTTRSSIALLSRLVVEKRLTEKISTRSDNWPHRASADTSGGTPPPDRTYPPE
jgi:hypothetical protein